MAPPPRIRAIESVPGAPPWLGAVLRPLNEALGQLGTALGRRLTRRENLYAGEKLDVTFRTPAAVTPTVNVKWDVVDKPRHVFVNGLARTDGAELTFAWSFSWRLTTGGDIELAFQGLDASTEYTCNVVWE